MCKSPPRRWPPRLGPFRRDRPIAKLGSSEFMKRVERIPKGAMVQDLCESSDSLSSNASRRASGEFLIATPSSSWSLLEAILDEAENDVHQSQMDCRASGVLVRRGIDMSDDEDDGLSLEEARLAEMASKLAELEQDTPQAYADVFDEPIQQQRTLPVMAAAVERKVEVKKSSKVAPFFFACLAIFLLYCASTLTPGPGAQRRRNKPHLIADRVKEMDTAALPLAPPTFAAPSPWAAPRPAAAFAGALRGKCPLGDALADATLGADRFFADQMALLHAQGDGVKLLASAGLGMAGLLVGIPYVPGITDNLLVGVAAGALPYFKGFLADVADAAQTDDLT